MENISQHLDSLIEITQKNVSETAAPLEENVQTELAKILCVARKVKALIEVSRSKQNKIKLSQSEAIIPNIKTVIFVLQGVPNTILAKKLRRDAEFTVRRLENPFTAFFINGFKEFLYTTTTPTKVIFGLLIALPVHLAAPVILAHLLTGANAYLKPILSDPLSFQPTVQKVGVVPTTKEDSKNRLTQYEFNEGSALLILSAIAGATGSVVSILTRIEQYRNEEYGDTLLPIFIGGFKPVIGAFFGILVFALVNSTLLPISITRDDARPATKWFAFLAIAFVIGFSERFAKDIVSQTERILPGDTSNKETANRETAELPVSDESAKNKPIEEK